MPRKIINVGRVKGTMCYTGTNPQEVEKPLENDLYLNKEIFKLFVFKSNVWEEVADFGKLVIEVIQENIKYVYNEINTIKKIINNLKLYDYTYYVNETIATIEGTTLVLSNAEIDGSTLVISGASVENNTLII